MKIILGSQSKNRKKILEEMGYEFETMAADIDEKAIRLESTEDLTLAIARAKAEALRPQIKEPAILITSDQVVVWNGQIREKPRDAEEAREFLEGYNFHPAETVTAVVATNTATGRRAEGTDIAKAHLFTFTQSEIDDAIKNGRVFELAGGFTIDGEFWERHIKKTEGTRDSIMGLPKSLTERLIKEVSG